MNPTLRSLQKELPSATMTVPADCSTLEKLTVNGRDFYAPVTIARETTLIEFGARISGIRCDRGNITAEAIAAACGITLGRYLEIERGNIDPPLSTLQKLAGVLRITITIKP